MYKEKRFSSVRILLSQQRNVLFLYLLLAFLASLQLYMAGMKTYEEGGMAYRAYNNYVIFKESFVHLKANLDLYVLYPGEHWDLFKYTPTFAVFFGLFNLLPDWLGLSAWNMLNVLVLLCAVYYLPSLSSYQKGLVLVLLVPELMTSTQNQQSNALIAGLLIFSFGLLERSKVGMAALLVVSSAFIKLFGVLGFVLFIFYPGKWKAVGYSIGWTFLLWLLPLGFVDIEQYQLLWKSYGGLLSDDHSRSSGLSVMGWFQTWFSWYPEKNLVVLAGAFLLVFPLLRWKAYADDNFRLLLLLSVLVWLVIFNHMAESPTYIIAMSGVVIWWVWFGRTYTDHLLFFLAMLFTSLSPTDVFPPSWREEWVKPYVLKAVPCILIWVRMQVQLWTTERAEPGRLDWDRV